MCRRFGDVSGAVFLLVQRVVMKRVVAWIVFMVAFAGSIALARMAALEATTNRHVLEVVSLPAVDTARLRALGNREMMADIELVRAQIYFADYVLQADRRSCDTLAHYLDTIVELDPHYREAYKLARSSLGQFCGMFGVADAVEILERGARENPDDCWYPLSLMWLYFMKASDCERMAAWAKVAEDIGHPEDMCGRGLSHLVKACQEERAHGDCMRRDWACGEAGRAGAKADPRYARMLARVCEGYTHLCGLNEQLIPAFQARTDGRCPADMAELWKTLGVRDLPPKEPFGGEYVLHASTCTFRSSSQLSPIPGKPLD